MPKLNFPTNRDELNPPQPSGPLQDGDEYAAAGITWTWNDTLGVWSADPSDGFNEAVADERYLSKVTNDRAAGEITFEKFVIIGGNPTNGTNTGTQIHPSGYFRACRDDDPGFPVFEGYDGTDDTRKVAIFAGGSAEFAGTVTAPNITNFKSKLLAAAIAAKTIADLKAAIIDALEDL